MIELHQFDSTNLDYAAYFPEDHTMIIRFHSGQLYGYMEVDPKTWEELTTVASPGGYFANAIRSKFPYRLLSKEGREG